MSYLFLLLVTIASNCNGSDIVGCITALQRSLGDSKVITSGIPQPYKLQFASIIPGAMVFAETGSDVSLVLNTALAHNVTVAVRSSAGHSYIGQSTIGGSGIVLNLARMKSFNVDIESDGSFRATLGAGLNNLEVYSYLAMHSPPLGIASGTCPSVGISGLISGGGEGMTSTFGGITSDRVVAAKAVVFVDGLYQEIVAPEDLLFALRGGMGGNYGVVTEWTVEVFVATKVLLYSLKTRSLDPVIDGPKISLAIRAHANWMRSPMMSKSVSLPPNNSVWGMSKFKSGRTIQLVGQCRCEEVSCSSCQRAVEYLETLVGGCEDGSLFNKCGTEVQDHGEAMWSWAGCTDFGGIDAYPSGGLSPSTPLPILDSAMKKCLEYDWENSRSFGKNKSLYLPIESELDMNFEQTAISLVSAPECNDGIAFCYLQMSFVGGRMIEETEDSAFVHRTPGWHIQMIISWGGDVPAEDAKYFAWAVEARELMLPMSIREAYQNYPDSDLPREIWSVEYFPRNGVFEKLIQIRKKYNPTDVLNVPEVLSMMIPLVD